MALGPGGGDGGPPGASETVQFGPPAPARRFRLGTLVLACLVAAAIVVVVTRPGAPRGAASPPPVAVTDIGHPILGIGGSWELFGLDGSGVVTIQFARGRIIRTAVPPLQSGGPVFFVAARGEVIIRPLDNVPGYVVPDGMPARRLTGLLATGGVLLPGPTLTEQWFGRTSLHLLGPSGKPVNAHLAAIARAWDPFWTMADGAGGILLVDSTSQTERYDARQGILRPVGTQLVAVGPATWLGMNCGSDLCQAVVITAATGATRALPGPPVSATSWISTLGAVAPDGRTAAVIVPSGDNVAMLELVSLTSGTRTRFAVAVGGAWSSGLAWSPDSRWLFVITAKGRLVAVDPRTGRVQAVAPGLSGFSQIAIRPGPR